MRIQLSVGWWKQYRFQPGEFFGQDLVEIARDYPFHHLSDHHRSNQIGGSKHALAEPDHNQGNVCLQEQSPVGAVVVGLAHLGNAVSLEGIFDVLVRWT